MRVRKRAVPLPQCVAAPAETCQRPRLCGCCSMRAAARRDVLLLLTDLPPRCSANKQQRPRRRAAPTRGASPPAPPPRPMPALAYAQLRAIEGGCEDTLASYVTARWRAAAATGTARRRVKDACEAREKRRRNADRQRTSHSDGSMSDALFHHSCMRALSSLETVSSCCPEPVSAAHDAIRARDAAARARCRRWS
jgi:hypothetical protein